MKKFKIVICCTIILFVILFTTFHCDQSPEKKIENQENLILKKILIHYDNSRLTLNQIKTETGPASHVTISELTEDQWSLELEFPNDKVPMVNFNQILFGHKSIHRFSGKVTFQPEGLVFHGEGDKFNRLTFCLLNDIGYVYVRGKGKVIFSDGRTVELGYK